MAELYVGTSSGMKEISIASEEEVAKLKAEIEVLKNNNKDFKSIDISFDEDGTEQKISSIKGKQYIIVKIGSFIGIVFEGTSAYIGHYVRTTHTQTIPPNAINTTYYNNVSYKSDGAISIYSTMGCKSATIYYK